MKMEAIEIGSNLRNLLKTLSFALFLVWIGEMEALENGAEKSVIFCHFSNETNQCGQVKTKRKRYWLRRKQIL